MCSEENKKRARHERMFLMATVGAALIAVGPASAQVHFGAGPSGVGVEAGPEPHPGWHQDHFQDRLANGSGYQVMQERTVAPSGRTIQPLVALCE